jgi:hypothetical protein
MTDETTIPPTSERRIASYARADRSKTVLKDLEEIGKALERVRAALIELKESL